MLKNIAIAILAAGAAPALGQVSPPPPSAPAAPQLAAAGQKVNPLDKMVCRYEDTLGTRLGNHKVCATVREWKDQEDENRQELDRVQQTTGVPTDPSGG